MTTLLEARCISGDPQLFEAMRAALAPEHVWRCESSSRRSSPSSANGPEGQRYRLQPRARRQDRSGGLRDIQTIAWVAKRHFGANTLDELATQNFLTPAELRR